MAEQTNQTSAKAEAAAGPTAVEAPPEKGNKVIKYVGLRADFVGPKGSHKEITKTQFKEAGVDSPFTDDRDVVAWTPQNGYSVARSVFTEAAVKRLLQEDDLEEATAD